MGGCCSSSREDHLNGTSVYQYHPRVSHERVALSAHNGAPTAHSTGFLVNTNLETSNINDVDLGRPRTPQGAREAGDAPIEETRSGSSFGTLATYKDLMELEYTTENDFILASPKKSGVELSKLSEPITEEDVCPTCLEEYDDENPKIITKCEHDFHLPCILEWMERSHTCPVCDQEMIFDHTLS